MPDAPPVFVDLTGRRRRHVRVAAVVAAASLLGVGALMVVALLGVPVGPSAYLPEPGQPPPTNQKPQVVETARNVETTSNKRPAPTGGEPSTAVVPTSAPASVPTTTTTTASKGKPDTPPGRPSGLPTPPGHTR